MKLYYYKNNKVFVCYTACGGMSIFNFLKHYYEERQIEYDWYQDIYKVVCNCSSFKQKEGFIKPEREKNGYRNYTDADLKILKNMLSSFHTFIL